VRTIGAASRRVSGAVNPASGETLGAVRGFV